MIRIFLLFLFVISISAAAQEISITIHPVSFSECEGKPAIIFINAESITNKYLLYQWFKDGEKVMGEVSPVLSFPSLQHNQSGLYFCRVYGEDGLETTDSRSASVYVLRPTSISSEPEDVRFSTFDGNVFLNFEVHINGFTVEEAIKKGEFVKIQWYRINDNIHIPLADDNIYSGTKTNRLSINLNTLPDTTKYFANVEGKCGIVSTRTASVIKNLQEIELKLEIEDLEVCEGTVQSLKAKIDNPQKHKLEFHWFKDGKPLYYKLNLNGIYSDELVFNPISVDDSGQYSLEARIKELNYKNSSNSIKVKIGKTPKIVCVRIDTSRKDFDELFPNWIMFKLFFEKNAIPIQFELYENGKVIGTYLSTDSKWSVGNIFIIQDFFNIRNDTSKYWVIATNKCGQDITDTISVHNQSFCDPFHLYQTNLCQNDVVTLEINYNGEISSDAIYDWYFDYNIGSMLVPTPKNDYINGIEFYKNKIIFHQINKMYNNGNLFFDFNRSVISLEILDKDRVPIDAFGKFYIGIKYLPVFIKQPVNKIINYGETDTLFNVIFDNEIQEDIHLTLYYMKSLDGKPKEIEKTLAEYGMWYRYIKDVTFSDDGYYFARVSNSPCDTISTDTIKVTVIQKGIVSGINGNKLNSYLSIYPNPASDFIVININNEASPIASGKVQIFNILGIEVKDLTPAFSINGGGVRIDVSDLPAGVYFIRIGDKVEKFVKL